MTSIISKIYAGAIAQCHTVILPEATDKRIIQAAIEVKSARIANPILLGSRDEIRASAEQHQLNIEDIVLYDPGTFANSDELRDYLRSRKYFSGLSDDEIALALQEPLTLACCLLATGKVDACVAGAVNTSGHVIRQALRIIGVVSDPPLLSSFFLMVFENPPVEGLDYALFADCAININPDGVQLAQIATTTVQSAQTLFGLDPKLALLSFSTDGSGSHADADKVAQAVQRIREDQPQQMLIGEVQFDAALSHSVRETKMLCSSFSGPANIFIFPDLDAGNIGAKIAERIGGAHSVGPILQGLRKPLNDLSRGANVAAIVDTIAITCLQADNVRPVPAL